MKISRSYADYYFAWFPYLPEGVTVDNVDMPFIRSAYNYDRYEASNESGLRCEDDTLAQQSFKDECDINTIVRRFGVTGQHPSGVRMPTYGDFTNVVDFHSAMNAVAQAKESFDAMPAEVRARFNNDPAQFVEFCSKEENKDEAVKLGLVDPAAVAAPGGTAVASGTGATSAGSTEPLGQASASSTPSPLAAGSPAAS